MRELAASVVLAVLMVVASCDLSFHDVASKHAQSYNEESIQVPTADKSSHPYWRSPIFRTRATTTERPYPLMPSNDFLGVYYEPADAQVYAKPIYMPYFLPPIYMPASRKLTVNAALPSTGIRNAKATIRKRDQNNVERADGSFFSDSLNRTSVFLDLSVDNGNAEDAFVLAKSRKADIDEVENVFMNCMDLHLAYMRLRSDNSEHLNSKVAKSEVTITPFRTAHELLSEMKVMCENPEKMIRSNVNDIMEATKVKRDVEMFRGDVLHRNAGSCAVGRLNGEKADNFELNEAKSKTLEAGNTEATSDFGTKSNSSKYECILNFNYTKTFTTEIPTTGQELKVALTNADEEVDPIDTETEATNVKQIFSSRGDSSDFIDANGELSANVDGNEILVPQNVRSKMNEAKVKIPAIEKHELSDGSVISVPITLEKLPNTDFIAQADVPNASKSPLIKILTGRMVFLHNNTTIPLKLQHNSRGLVDLAVNGNYLCDRLKNSPADNSIILASLCKVSD